MTNQFPDTTKKGSREDNKMICTFGTKTYEIIEKDGGRFIFEDEEYQGWFAVEYAVCWRVCRDILAAVGHGAVTNYSSSRSCLSVYYNNATGTKTTPQVYRGGIIVAFIEQPKREVQKFDDIIKENM